MAKSRFDNMSEYNRLKLHKWRIEGKTWDEIAELIGENSVTLRHWAARNGFRTRKTADSSKDALPHPSPQFATPKPEPPTFDELIDLADQTRAANDKVDPILTHETIRLDADAPVAIIFESCMHLGSRYVDHPKFRKFLMKLLEMDRVYWFSLGDDTEGFTGFFDRRSAHEQALADPKNQRTILARVLDMLKEKGKLLCGFSSQHGSQWVSRLVGEDPIKALYLERDVPYFDGQGYITLEVGKQKYGIFGGHDLPGHSMYNLHHAQRRALLYRAPLADVVVRGDKHVGGVQWITNETMEPNAPARQYLVQAGTLKTGNDPYTIRNWTPGKWAWPILVFRHDRHEIAEAATLDQAQHLMKGW